MHLVPRVFRQHIPESISNHSGHKFAMSSAWHVDCGVTVEENENVTCRDGIPLLPRELLLARMPRESMSRLVMVNLPRLGMMVEAPGRTMWQLTDTTTVSTLTNASILGTTG